MTRTSFNTQLFIKEIYFHKKKTVSYLHLNNQNDYDV